MRLQVLDTNYLQRPDLERYLDASRSNAVVLIDLVSMEIHKKNAVVSARASTEILYRFPRQVFVLRPTTTFYPWQLVSRAKVNRLISSKESASFRRYATGLHSLGSAKMAEEYARRREGGDAQHALKLIRDSEHIPRTFKEFTAKLPNQQLEELRERVPFSKELQLALLGWAREIGMSLFRNLLPPDHYRPNHVIRIFDTFFFRYALCMVLLYTRWVNLGQQMQRRPEKFANDVVDMHIAAMSTFFSGVLSNDGTVVSVAREARYILRVGGAFVG